MAMELSDRDIQRLIQESYDVARAKRDADGSLQIKHQRRSQNWVEVLADGFKEHFRDDPEIAVFSKHDPSHIGDFGLNELLYDILVCRVGEVESAKQKKRLYYIREAIWQIESEFAEDSRQALIDFNKLVIGRAKNKLFVGTQVSDNTSYLNVLASPARICQNIGDRVYAVLLPHPRDWNHSNSILMWRFESGWIPLNGPGLVASRT